MKCATTWLKNTSLNVIFVKLPAMREREGERGRVTAVLIANAQSLIIGVMRTIESKPLNQKKMTISIQLLRYSRLIVRSAHIHVNGSIRSQKNNNSIM
jgi:hypothetical protein